ncbi:MATE family efflux transporter [Parageobacillus thermoglucosidasius]|uniref:MATE family efflux transporter n=2 Tax=Parageobacillus thermoglucosidasius TaxID=1426 RepID=A0AAN1D747_PARTM|nr:MATE family efflux transporter [Parageobacillus thermoglucosidasius]ALF10715.1 MATE family efflux transporter [Parageobacillus thermoglucosidasius]ANZ30793.1 MATE family efflux transporter [Parageobacillus thermoglucosidasius]APM81530.1 MATE family efflux transporter [Parageobacillus thermoglucosidasius]KJX69364.1 multidrug transporter [Parageobacillus thermoglucosidasius]RDE22123.1 MATE family efflux transporter [Parageobacillus thermoglucosidasius]
MERQYDFTEGNIAKQLVVFSFPIIFANLLQVSYQFIDSFWVGNLLGADSLAAVAVAGTVIYTILSFIIGMNNAALTILSQQKGKNDNEGLKRYVNAFIVLLTGLSVIMGIFGFFASAPILRWIGTPKEIMEEASEYLQINCLGIVFLFGYNFIGTVLRALGDSKTPLVFVIMAVLLNAVLDPLFISWLDLGVSGAAYATILSQGLSFVCGMYAILRRGLVPFSLPKLPTKKETGLILKLGIPSGLQMSVISAGIAAIMSVVNSFGESVVAGFSAAQRLDSIIMLPAHALGTAVNSMAGQNIGKGNWKRVSSIAAYGVLYNMAVTGFIIILIYAFAAPAVRLFIEESDAVRFGTEYLRLIGWFYPFLGINFVLNGIVRASGAMYQVLVLNIISFWVLRYPLTFLCSKFAGENGIALGMGISFVVSSVIAFSYYRFGSWKNKKLFAH